MVGAEEWGEGPGPATGAKVLFGPGTGGILWVQRSGQSQNPLGIPPEYFRLILRSEPQPSNALLHLLQASDEVGVVTSCKDLVHSGEVDGHPEGSGVEVHRVVEEVFEVFRRRLGDVLP